MHSLSFEFIFVESNARGTQNLFNYFISIPEIFLFICANLSCIKFISFFEATPFSIILDISIICCDIPPGWRLVGCSGKTSGRLVSD